MGWQNALVRESAGQHLVTAHLVSTSDVEGGRERGGRRGWAG
jgi:hypothetical protein